MIKRHYQRIEIRKDGVFSRNDVLGGYRKLRLGDNNYITCDFLEIQTNAELPKYLKEIKSHVSCGCYCPMAVKGIDKLLDNSEDCIDFGLGSAYDNEMTIEKMQEMINLTINSIDCIDDAKISLDCYAGQNDNELHFDTNADVHLWYDGNELELYGKVGKLNLLGRCKNKIKLRPDFICTDFECGGEEADAEDFKDYSLLPDGFDESLEDGDFEFKDLVRRIPPRIRNGKLNGTLKSVRWTTTTNLDDIWDKIPDQYKKIICRTMSRYIGSALKQIADDDGWEFTQKNGFGIHTCWGEDELKKLGITKYNIDYRGGSCIHVRYEFHIEKFGGLPDLDESADIKINKRLKHKISTKIQKGEKSGDINSIHWTLTTSADEFWDKIPDDLKSEILERVCWVFVDRGGEENEISADYEGIVGVQYSIWTDYSTDDILGMGFTAHDIVIREDNESSVLLSFKISLDKLGNLPDGFNESLVERLRRLVL